MGARIFLVALLALALSPCAGRANDYGTRAAVSRVRRDVRRLLARRTRHLGVDPKQLVIDDVVVVKNEAFASWDDSRDHGVMGLLYRDNRWWDAYEAVGRIGGLWHATAFPPLKETWWFTTALPSVEQLRSAGFSASALSQAQIDNADIRAATQQGKALLSMADPACLVLCGAITQLGGSVHSNPDRTAGYELWIAFARSDAAGTRRVTLLYARAPTPAEFLPNPTPAAGMGGPTDVAYFDVDVDGSTPLTFASGTAVDIWFPFVLDDTLRYDISYFTAEKSYGPYRGTIFDNTLHFELPGFTIVPGKPLQAEISGWY